MVVSGFFARSIKGAKRKEEGGACDWEKCPLMPPLPYRRMVMGASSLNWSLAFLVSISVLSQNVII